MFNIVSRKANRLVVPGTTMEVYVVIHTASITDLFKRIFKNDINISKNLKI